MSLIVNLFQQSGDIAQHPSASVTVPPGYKIIGGGAVDKWSGVGNMLTGSYPAGNQWIANGKDHQVADPSYIIVYAVGLFDPNDEWDVKVFSQTSNPAEHPTVVAPLDPGYKLTGGGALVDYNGGYGNILTASFPNGDSGWEARSKDHLVADAAKLTAYAIGVRPKGGQSPLRNTIQSSTGATAAHPTAQVCLDDSWILSCGGAIDNWNEPGNLLTASYPSPTETKPHCWVAAGKDQIVSSPSNITVYAIGIQA